MDKLKLNIENQRKCMGYLKFNNDRSYPVYEGINIIGRDVKATIRVKDLTLSKQHAIISIVNNTTCFISDFDSSNGTHVRNIKLVPFKFYDIHDLETIIFGDIIASYHTSISENSEIQNETFANESQIPSTQILPQNIHDVSTQKSTEKTQSQSIHFEQTQLIHNAETQPVMKPYDQPSCSKITDGEPSCNTSKNECDNEIYANETIIQSLQNTKYDVVVDETLPNESKLDQSANKTVSDLTLEDDDIILSTQDNAMIDKEAMDLQNKNATSNKDDDDDDSETDLENEEEFLKNIKDKSTQIINDKKKNSSDSETDIEDNNVLKKYQTEYKTNSNENIQNVSSPVHSATLNINHNENISDDEEDIDLLSDNIQLDIANHNEDDDDLLLVPTQLLQNRKLNNEDESNTDLQAPTQLLENKNDKKIEDDTEDDLLAPTQLLSGNTKEKSIDMENDDLLAPTQLLQTKNSVNQIDDEMLAPTQLLSSESRHKPVEDDNNVEVLAPTQLLGNNNDKHVENEIEDDMLAPTQLLASKSNKKQEVSDEEDDLLAPTQLLQGKMNKNVQENTDSDEDDDLLAPTQLLQSKMNNVVEGNKNNEEDLASTQLLQSKNPNESIFSMPTQLLDKVTPKKSCILNTSSPRNKEKKNVNFSENIFDIPTQKLGTNIYEVPTQLLEPQDKQENNKISPAIQSVENKDSQTSSSSSRSSLNNTQNLNLILSETDDDSICVKKNTSNVPHNTEPETQLEVNFELDTQKIYVEQKTSRPDNPLAHMFAEEPTQMTEEIECNNKIVNIEANRRLQIKLKDVRESSSSTNTLSTSDENEIKLETKKRRGRKPKKDNQVVENTTKLNIIKIKTKPDKSESESDTAMKKSENSDEVAKSTRTRRATNQQSVAKTEIKKSRVSEIKKSVRSERNRSPKLTADKTDNSSDMDDFVNRITRTSKRAHGVSGTPNKKQKIEQVSEDDTEEIIVPKKKIKKLEYTQDDSSDNLEIREKSSKQDIKIEQVSDDDSEEIIVSKKKVKKLEYTQDDNSEKLGKSSKRNMKIEDYSSDEKSSSSICVNTPNTKRRRFDPLNVTLNNFSTDSVRHKIVFTMLNDTELENSIKKLGGIIIDNVNMCTALVTNKISRSLKFLVAVALGKPIVQPKWILDSIKKNYFLDPWDYILVDNESELKYKFNLKESLKKSNEKKLLTDLVILLATKKNSDVLKEIIETSGGKCIQRVPAKNGKAIVVSYEDEKSKYSKYLKQKSLTVVAAEAIFSGVLQQELKLNEHLLN